MHIPVNYNGEYHYRTGSTKQLLRGPALTNFLIAKTGIRWESAVVPELSIDDLDRESFKIFRREAVRSGRMTKAELDISDAELMDKLGLLSNGKITKICYEFGQVRHVQRRNRAY